jgi:hypothetical protein
VKKISSVVVIAALAAAAAPSAGGVASQPNATVSSGFVHIGGPNRLHARKMLKVPVTCSVDCNIRARFTLVLPGPNVGPQVVTGTLHPGIRKALFITLNGPALQALKDNIGRSKLKVRVHATDQATGATASDFKIFRFKRG